MAFVEIYDTTLRDGAQSEGISFSLGDKIHIVEKLDELGVRYIEGGWPGSNPKDAAFFKRVQKVKLLNARIAVFGSTSRVGVKAEEDSNVTMMVESGASVATIVAKASDLQVKHVLNTTREENLSMIEDTKLPSKSQIKNSEPDKSLNDKDGVSLDLHLSLSYRSSGIWGTRRFLDEILGRFIGLFSKN